MRHTVCGTFLGTSLAIGWQESAIADTWLEMEFPDQDMGSQEDQEVQSHVVHIGLQNEQCILHYKLLLRLWCMKFDS